MMTSLRTLFIVGIAFAPQALVPQSRPASSPANPKNRPELLERVVVVGASASAGFSDMKSQPHPLRNYVERMIEGPHSPVGGSADAMFFMSPEETGKREVDFALTKNPTLVVATDFLFWYGYGDVTSEEERLAGLEKGLAEVDRLPCPVIVGDFPDASAAIGKILSKGQVPKPETLQKLNERLAKWRTERPRIVVVPFSTWLPKLQNAEDASVRGNHWEKGVSGRLLCPDRLHLTEEGTAALAVIAMDAAASQLKGFPTDRIRFDARALMGAPASAPSSQPKR